MNKFTIACVQQFCMCVRQSRLFVWSESLLRLDMQRSASIAFPNIFVQQKQLATA